MAQDTSFDVSWAVIIRHTHHTAVMRLASSSQLIRHGCRCQWLVASRRLFVASESRSIVRCLRCRLHLSYLSQSESSAVLIVVS
jgi:hypothetical protein